MSIERAKELCRKYAKSTEYYDDLVEGNFVEMPPIARKLVNQVGDEILKELEMAEERKISTKLDLTIEEAVKERSELLEYRASEKWVYSVIEKIDRRLADLNNLIAQRVTDEQKD